MIVEDGILDLREGEHLFDHHRMGSKCHACDGESMRELCSSALACTLLCSPHSASSHASSARLPKTHSCVCERFAPTNQTKGFP